jgi:hypothetical protein
MKKLLILLLAVILMAIITGCRPSEEKQYSRYSEFYNTAEKEYLIPGLDDEFIPQGLCFIEKTNMIAVSGYMDDNRASRIYLIDADTGSSVKKVLIRNSDGTDYTGHGGGIVSYEDYLWISSSSYAHRISLEDLLTQNDEGYVDIIDRFDTNTNASFIYCKNSQLWVGEFYEKKNYSTNESHHFLTADNKQQNAVVCIYDIDLSKPYGVSSTIPSKVISIADKVQGMCITQTDKIVLSISYGRKNDSYLYVYENIVNQSSDAVIDINGNNINVLFLDTDHIVKIIKAPPMTEGLMDYMDKVYILFESAASKYAKTSYYPQKTMISITID